MGKELEGYRIPVAPPEIAPKAHKRLGPKAKLGIGATIVASVTIALGVYADKNLDKVAEFSRSVIGDENTARIERWFFYLQDQKDQLDFKLFGGRTNPFDKTEEVVSGPDSTSASPAISYDEPVIDNSFFILAPPEPPKPAPLILPETRPILQRDATEGVWTIDGLPRTSPEDILMAKTFINPDSARPYATVGVLLLDKRRISLHMTGGFDDPGGDRGIRGPGIIPESDRPNLLVAWNGGFRGPHGGYGMVADGKEYRPLRNGLASVAVMGDGTILMGQWGRDLVWDENMVAVRQNAVLLVEDCNVTQAARDQGTNNDVWGYVEVNSAEFITWRSAIGLTQNGDLLVAAGNSLSANSLARALQAAGACTAMQLDINTPYVLTSLFFQEENGAITASKVMSSMTDGPGRLLN